MLRTSIITAFLFIFVGCYGNDSLLMSNLLKRIDYLQVKHGGVFPAGSIASYRMYALNKARQKADVNAFFTGLVSFTLRDLMNDLSPSQQLQAQQIIANTLPVYSKFQNKKGRPTYNFSPTDTPKIFTNSGWMNLFDKSKALPDDLDDTVIMLLAMNATDATANEVHTLMQSYTNTSEKQVRNTFKNYRNINAYSTWFGKKMPIDFDICVLANVLYFVQRYNLKWTHADSASMQLIVKMVADKKYLSAPAYISPYYSRVPNILYHLARLMSVKPLASLEKYQPQLINDAKAALQDSRYFMDEVILSTALLRWKTPPPPGKPYQANDIFALAEEGDFCFFVADIATMLPDPWKKWMAATTVGKFYYYSPAYNDLLLLENLVLRKRMHTDK